MVMKKREIRSSWENDLGKILDYLYSVERDVESQMCVDENAIREMIRFKNLIDSRMKKIIVKSRIKQKNSLKEKRRKRVEKEVEFLDERNFKKKRNVHKIRGYVDE